MNGCICENDNDTQKTYIKARHVNSVPDNDVDEVIWRTVLPKENFCIEDF